jgi:hypothetical protein
MARVVCMISKRSLVSGMPVLPEGDYPPHPLDVERRRAQDTAP